MKEEASNPIQVIIDLTVEWRLPIGVSSLKTPNKCSLVKMPWQMTKKV